MKYASIDIETTGLNDKYCQVIEFGAVLDDLNDLRPLDLLPRFHAYVLHNIYVGEPYALAMHAEIFRRIAKLEPPFKYVHETALGEEFAKWLVCQGHDPDAKLNVAGNNFGGFDNKFLAKLPSFYSRVKLHHRFIDPAILFLDPSKDKAMPGLEECLKRANKDSEVTHTAVEDALQVIKLVRTTVVN